jgi:hypothetical protein
MTFREFIALIEDAPVSGAVATAPTPSVGGTSSPTVATASGSTTTNNTLDQLDPQIQSVLTQGGWNPSLMQRAVNSATALKPKIKEYLIRAINAF